MKNLQRKLEIYSESDFYPFHMPGHKRNTDLMKMENPYGIDITEIDGFDNLYMADGILKDIKKETALLYHADNSYLLVNGSTAGILMGMAACTKHGDKVIMARNCHRAVYHGLYLNELVPVYIYPEGNKKWGINSGISAADVDKVLKKNVDAKMVIITSPTYEGVLSDIEGIANTVHKRGIPLLVDEAHGAHFGFHPYFPQSSNQKGADLVIHSVHKTLPAFTQSALLHLNGTLVSKSRLERIYAMYQSSSPSYILMAGIENSLSLIKNRYDLMDLWERNLKDFYKAAEGLNKLRVLTDELEERDPSKLIISVRNTLETGTCLYNILRDKYHLQMEAAFPDYVIAMTSMADEKKGFIRLAEALKEIDKFFEAKEEAGIEEITLPVLERKFTPYETEYKEEELIKLAESKGRISKESIFLYPPGIPVIVPGEVISEAFLQVIQEYRESGLDIKGLHDRKAEHILAVKEN